MLQTVLLRGVAEAVTASVQVVGQGQPVVFLHGLVGLNDHWEEVARRISSSCRCTMLELPLLDLKKDDCSVQGVTELTTQYLKAHTTTPAILVGNSFGGHVALRIALDHPELVSALVLAGSSGLLERTMVQGAPVRPSREWLIEKIGELFYDKSFMRESDLDRAHEALSQKQGARAMVRLSRTARRDHLGERINQIQCPTLLIWGKEDVVTPTEAATQFNELIPDARLVWFDRCGHAPMIECPDRFGAAILAFVNDLDEAASHDHQPQPKA